MCNAICGLPTCHNLGILLSGPPPLGSGCCTSQFGSALNAGQLQYTFPLWNFHPPQTDHQLIPTVSSTRAPTARRDGLRRFTQRRL